jgi:hypothetical protein
VKRLVWLLLFAFGTALAQVSPVDVRLNPGETCSCCDRPGACDMPDCLPTPVSTQLLLQTASPAQTIRVAAKRTTPAPHQAREVFYVQFLPRVSVAPALPVCLAVAPPASVPLFQEHCSWLI